MKNMQDVMLWYKFKNKLVKIAYLHESSPSFITKASTKFKSSFSSTFLHNS